MQQQPFQFNFGQIQQAVPSNNIFGQPLNQGINLFGQPQQQTQSNGIFGQPAAQNTGFFGQPIPQGTFTFGQSKPQTTGIFGQPLTTAQGTGLFGQPVPQTTSFFGQPTQSSQTSSFFRQPVQQQTTGIFGQPLQQQQTGLFGQSVQQQPLGIFGLPQQTTSPFGTSNNTTSTSPFNFSNLNNNKAARTTPTFNFGQSSTTNTTPIFSFGQPNTNSTATPIFNFGQPTGTNNTTPIFSFGQPTTTTNTTPTWNFNPPNVQTQQTLPQNQFFVGNQQQQRQQPMFQPQQAQQPLWYGQPQQQPIPMQYLGYPAQNDQFVPQPIFYPMAGQTYPMQPNNLQEIGGNVGFSQQQQLNWGNTGDIPSRIIDSTILGRSPSIFSSDPDNQSPLFNWKRNPSSWKTYASSLNPSVASSLVDPPGLWTLPSAHSQKPRLSNIIPLISSSNRDSDFINWKTYLDNKPKENNNYCSKKSSQENLRHLSTFQGFKMAYDMAKHDERLDPAYHFHSSFRLHPNNSKKLDVNLVQSLERLNTSSRNNYTFDNKSPKIGDQFKRNILYSSSSVRKPPPVGLFEQPFANGSEFSSTPPTCRGPPKSNNYDYETQTGQRFVNEYNNLVNKQGQGCVPTRLPLNLSPISSFGDQKTNKQNPPTRVRFNTDPITSPAKIPRTLGHEPGLSANRNLNTRSGVIITKPMTYCIPDVATLDLMVDPSGKCMVENFEVGHRKYGSIIFPGSMNVKGLNLDNSIYFKRKEIEVYPNDVKPLYGTLNRRAIVTLLGVWPVEKATGEKIRDAKKIELLNYRDTLNRACDRFDGIFKCYDSDSGKWTFEIQNNPTR